MKTNKRLLKLLSVALCLALVMSYVPMVSLTAFATEGGTPITTLYINESAVITDGNVVGAISGEGWHFDTDTATLIVSDGAALCGDNGSETTGSGVYCEGDIAIVVNGTALFYGVSNGIHMASGKLSLNVESGVATIKSANSGYGIYVTKDAGISVYVARNAVLNLTGYQGGANIHSEQDAVLSGGGTLNAIASTISGSSIFAVGTLKIDGLTFNGTAKGSTSPGISASNLIIGEKEAANLNLTQGCRGIYAEKGTVSIYNGSVLTVSSVSGDTYACGILADDIVVQDSTVKFDNLMGTSHNNVGFRGNLTVSGNSHIVGNVSEENTNRDRGFCSGTVTIKGNYYYRASENTDFEYNSISAKININYFELVTEEHGIYIPVDENNHFLVCGGTDCIAYTALSQPENHNFDNELGECEFCGVYEDAELNEEGCYEISNAGQLMWFAEFVNSGNKSANAILTADIDMTGVEWTPICSTDLYYLTDPDAHNGDWGYTGTFDGNGYSIKNLSVTGSETADASFGVFGTLSGTVKNLGVVNFTYVGAGMDSRVGAIAGQVLKDGLITDCYLENGNIDTQINTENGVAGGIAGSNYAGTIQNCYVHAFTVKAGRAGGIVGDNYGDANNEDGTDRPGTITNCYTSTGGICNRGTSTNSLANVSDNLYASGEIVCRLNNGTSEGVWKQNGTLPDFEGDTIYRNTCAGDVYYGTSNIDYEAHNINGLVCENCGCYDAANLVTSDNYEALGLTSDFAGFYAIESASNLYWFAQQVNNGNRTVNAKLVNDIDLGNHQWIPIGLSNIKFSGTFDGNGKAITGFNINAVSSGAYGLFGYIQNATVRNFYIDGSVTVNVPEGSEIHVGVIGSSYTSGNQYTYIQNITSDIDVTVHDSYMKNTVAGIVGVISADRGSGNWGRTYIQQCTFSGNIDLGNATVDCGGGIAGYVNYNISVRIQNCLYSGTYSGESGQVGGIAGYYNGDNVWLTNCLSIGQINLTNTRFIGALGGRYINLNNDSVDSRIVNNYYLTGTLPSFSDNAEATNDVVNLGLFDGGNALGVTSEQLASGEIAYRLGSSWGQNSNTGGSHPIVTINSLYKVARVGETGNYSVANIGDTNADGTVDINDYQGLVNVILADDHEQIEAASYNDIIRYDLDGDGCLDVIDASLMHNFINGFITVDVYAVGDYDCNGKAFEDADIKAVKHALENPEKLSTAEKYACDITGDGKVDESDLAKLNALYGESETVKCEDNLKVYYTYKNNYKTCTATAICTLCNKTVVTETVKTTSETLSELTCTQDGEYKYTANFTNELFGTKINEVTVITKGHNFVDRKCTECSAVAEITGVAIIIDGVEYNKDSGTSESNPAIIKPDSTVKFKVYGTNLNYATDENCFFKDYGTYLTLDRADSLKFVYNETNTELTIDYHIDYFQRNTNVVELQFGNNGANGELLSGGVWYAYPPEQVVDANITGVALIVDGVEYNEGLVTVRAESRVVVKVYGTNLSENGVTNGDFVLYGEIFGANLNNGRWTFNEDGLSATYEEIAGNMYIGYVEPYTILYCNDVYGNWVSSGLSVIYVAE